MSWPACPGCGRTFPTLSGVDQHRRHRAAAEGCRYRPHEPRIGYRPGLLARGAITPHWG